MAYKVKLNEMKAICKPLNINVDERWLDGFLVSATNEQIIKDGLEPLGFVVVGIGIGRDYNRDCVILHAQMD